MSSAVATFGVAVVFCFLLQSCHSNQTRDGVTRMTYIHTDSSRHEHIDSTASVITGTLTSKKGDHVRYTFDNSAGTMTVLFHGDLSVLKQDTTASGIKYSNQTYTYTEWHGAAALRKNGQTVFESGGNQ